MSTHLSVNELVLECIPETAIKHHGKVVYTITLLTLGMSNSMYRRVATGVRFPSDNTIKVLAEKYLESEIEINPSQAEGQLDMLLPTGLRKSFRFLFLAAIYDKCKFTYS